VNIIIRNACPEDTAELHRLNELFNGAGSNTAEKIRESLQMNQQELVAIAIDGDHAVGFICGQIFKSICYSVYYGEITELFVQEEYQRQGIGRRMLCYMEQLFAKESIRTFQLFTGGDNQNAQRFYEAQGYLKTEEIMYRKR